MNAQRDAQQGGGTSNEQYALLGLFTSGTGYIYTHAPRLSAASIASLSPNGAQQCLPVEPHGGLIDWL
jgi:hypothetical protein